jgi:hypothetical protein
MNTKYLMISSSFFTGLIGVVTSFLPKEILNNVGQGASEFSILIMQIAGALYLGFAMMNWMAKSVLIGGIYARPLCMGNFLHFSIAAIVLIKATMNTIDLKFILIAAIVYSVFAILFGIVLFTSPGKKQ